MSDAHQSLGDHAMDALKATPAVTFWTTWFWGVNWTALGAFLMAVYTLLLIVDKLGILAPVKAFGARCFAGMWRRKNVA